MRLILGVLMLLASDIAASRNSDLRPNAQSSINTIASVRSVTATTATYGAYSAGFGGSLMSYTFPANSVTAGTQIRIRLFGTANNTSGVPQTFLPATRITQLAASDAVATTWQITDSGGITAWEVDSVLTFSAPQSSTTGGTAARSIGVPASSYSALVVGGMQRLILSNASATGATIAGGVVLATPGSVDQSYLITSIDPNSNLMVNTGQPIGVSLELTSDVDFTVQGGWMEAL